MADQMATLTAEFRAAGVEALTPVALDPEKLARKALELASGDLALARAKANELTKDMNDEDVVLTAPVESRPLSAPVGDFRTPRASDERESGGAAHESGTFDVDLALALVLSKSAEEEKERVQEENEHTIEQLLVDVVAPTPPYRVVIMGSINMDMQAIALSTEWPALSGGTVGSRSVPGRLLYSPGGRGANEAVAIARLGVPVKLIGRVGQDAHGERLIASLRQVNEGLDQPWLDVSAVCKLDDPTVATGTAVQLITERDKCHFSGSHMHTYMHTYIQCS